uniref:CCHC-type domain-containing protein n=1 Tax=Aegilops tauschii subsp. strangulata TaxID=200361 RepID=A0A453Q7B6_AEGTS
MVETESLDAFDGRLGGMAARYAALGSTLEDAALVKKLLDSVPDNLYAAVAGIEQFCDVGMMAFEDALGRLKAFDERLRRRGQAGGERADGAHVHGGAMAGVGAASGRCAGRRRRAQRGVGLRRQPTRLLLHVCRDRGHFKRECPQWKKAPAAEHALLVDDVVEEPSLL